MARCDQCGNDYDKSFEVNMAGKTHTFDSFECAIQRLAPTCPIVVAGSSGMASSRARLFTAAHIAPPRKALTLLSIGRPEAPAGHATRKAEGKLRSSLHAPRSMAGIEPYPKGRNVMCADYPSY